MLESLIWYELRVPALRWSRQFVPVSNCDWRRCEEATAGVPQRQHFCRPLNAQYCTERDAEKIVCLTMWSVDWNLHCRNLDMEWLRKGTVVDLTWDNILAFAWGTEESHEYLNRSISEILHWNFCDWETRMLHSSEFGSKKLENYRLKN